MIHAGAQIRASVLHGLATGLVLAVVPGALALACVVWIVQRFERRAGRV